MYDLSQGYIILNIRKLHLREQLRALVKCIETRCFVSIIRLLGYDVGLDPTQLNELEVNVNVIAHI